MSCKLIKENTPLLDAVIIEPKTSAKSCVIWLHGLGADGHDFVDAIPSLCLPSNHAIRFVFPHAPHRPVTINGGMMMPAWYDIFALDLEATQDESGIRESEQQVKAHILHAIENGIPANQIILIGFSQGGAMALHTGIRYEQKIAGVAGLSTYLPLHHLLAKEQNKANRELPIFMAHGFMDPVVSYWVGQKSLACLKGAGYDPKWHDYPMVHTVCLPELNALGQWIQDILAR